MGVCRDPGYRAKLAVRTANENVDPVGACVGQRGSRVRSIVNELNGEKIDIVRWNEDIRQYVAQALAPAKLESIDLARLNSDTFQLGGFLPRQDSYSEPSSTCSIWVSRPGWRTGGRPVVTSGPRGP